jgi:DNA primase large subunit
MSRAEIIDDVLDEVKVDGAINWKSLRDVIATKKLKLTDLLIDEGDVVLQQDDFLYRFGDEFTDRSPDRMYNILIGDSVKEQILSRMIMQKTEEYIARIKEMSSRIEIHPAIIKIGEDLKDFIPEEISKYNQYYAGSGGIYLPGRDHLPRRHRGPAGCPGTGGPHRPVDPDYGGGRHRQAALGRASAPAFRGPGRLCAL